MAKITDLTFAQLNAELGVNAFSYDAANTDIKLSLKALTNDSFTALTNSGVTETVHKLITACQEAQVTANSADGVATEDQLRSFPSPTNRGFDPITLQIPIRHTVEVSLNVDPNNVRGVNV